MKIKPAKKVFNFSNNKYSEWKTCESAPVKTIDFTKPETIEVPITQSNIEQMEVPTPGTVAYFRYMENHDWVEPASKNIYYEIFNDVDNYNSPSYSDYNNYIYILNSLVDSGKMSFSEKSKSDEREQKYGVDNVFLYYYLLDQKFENKMDFQTKYKLANQIAIVDKENNYSIAHQTPIIVSGKRNYSDAYSVTMKDGSKKFYDLEYEGEYFKFFNEDSISVEMPLANFYVSTDLNELYNNHVTKLNENGYENYNFYKKQITEYYTSIMEEKLKYSTDYSNYTIGKLESLNFINIYGTQYGGITQLDGKSVQLNIGTFFTNYSEGYKDWYYNKKFMKMIGSYNHEMGHVYAINKYNYVYVSSEWIEICKQIEQIDSNHELLRDYAYTNPAECFAEVIAEYYNYNQTASDLYNPNDLKLIEINYGNYTNLYDYIDNLVNLKG